jgi:beta-lactamase class A
VLTEATLGEIAETAGLADPAIVVRSIDTRSPEIDLSWEASRPLYPASMIKTPLAAATLLLVGRGELALTGTAAIEGSNMTVNDLPSPLVPGYRARIDELLELMIAQSDNVATNVLIDVLGRERATALLHEQGFSGTAIRRKLSGGDPLIDDPQASGRNEHPAAEAARLFTALAQNEIPHARLLLNNLVTQRWNSKLSRGLRSGDRFAHKTGDTSEVSHDGGLLRTAEGRTYVIVVYTALPSSDEADARFASFMSSLRPHL